MTDAQMEWFSNNPRFTTIGRPRPVRFSEWGTLSRDGVYERLDNQPRKPIQVGTGNIGVAVIEGGSTYEGN